MWRARGDRQPASMREVVEAIVKDESDHVHVKCSESCRILKGAFSKKSIDLLWIKLAQEFVVCLFRLDICVALDRPI